MSLSLYIILSVCVLMGVIFLVLARSTKEEKVSLEPPKVRGGTLFVPTVPHHVKIDPPEIMKSRLVAEELFVDYSIPGFGRKGSSNGDSSANRPEPATPSSQGPAPLAGAADVIAAEESATKLEAEASGFVENARIAGKMKAQEESGSGFGLQFKDEMGIEYVRDSEETISFDALFTTEVIVKQSVSANPDLDPSRLEPGENFMKKRNGTLMDFLDTEVFGIYSEIMEQVDVIIESDPSREVLMEFTRLMNKRDLSDKQRNLLLTTFYKEQPVVAGGTYRTEGVFLGNSPEMEEFMV